MCGSDAQRRRKRRVAKHTCFGAYITKQATFSCGILCYIYISLSYKKRRETFHASAEMSRLKKRRGRDENIYLLVLYTDEIEKAHVNRYDIIYIPAFWDSERAQEFPRNRRHIRTDGWTYSSSSKHQQQRPTEREKIKRRRRTCVNGFRGTYIYIYTLHSGKKKVIFFVPSPDDDAHYSFQLWRCNIYSMSIYIIPVYIGYSEGCSHSMEKSGTRTGEDLGALPYSRGPRVYMLEC